MGTDISFETAIRAVQSAILGLHSVVGIAEPFTGLLRRVFGHEMPRWFFPTAGILHATFAYLNMFGSDTMILLAQAYIASFHLGASFFHIRLSHHPLASLAPSGFVLFAIIVSAFRTTMWMTVLGLLACIALAAALTWTIVIPPSKQADATPLFGSKEAPSSASSSSTFSATR